jgi:starch synthase
MRAVCKVLQVSAELFPWLKTGGLADVTGALPAALAGHGVEVRALVPGFPAFLNAVRERQYIGPCDSAWGERLHIERVRLDPAASAWVYLLVAPHLYERGGSPYEDEHRQAFGDNHRRFAALSWAAKALAEGLDPAWQPDLIHAHDWHAGLTALYMKFHRARGAAPVPCLFTIHNLAYRGLFSEKHLEELAIPRSCWQLDGLEFYGQLSMLKAGIEYADRVSTVSPSYAREIQTPEQGQGLDGFLRRHAGRLSGILNGIDTSIWSPSRDPHIAKPYAETSLADKESNVLALEAVSGLRPRARGPRCAIISRLTEQKGLGLIVQAAAQMIQDGSQLVVLGSGDAELERQLRLLQAQHPGEVSFHAGFSETLAHQILAGSDLVLVPSLFEPCGLTQMYGMRYGSPPLVHLVGGLADTVKPWSPDADKHGLHALASNGFGFRTHTLDSFLSCWRDVLLCWRDRPSWLALQRRGMGLALGWHEAAGRYAKLYETLLLGAAQKP